MVFMDIGPHVKLCLPGRDDLLVGWVGELELRGLRVTQIPDLASEVLELLGDRNQITARRFCVTVRDFISLRMKALTDLGCEVYRSQSLKLDDHTMVLLRRTGCRALTIVWRRRKTRS